MQGREAVFLHKNYHTHTTRCCHAQGADADYAAAALAQGFTAIGFSDHTPWPFHDYVSGMRMPASALDEYVQSVLSVRDAYRGRLDVLLGLECEYFPQYLPWLCAMAEKHALQYVILGHHFSGDEPGGIYNGDLKRAEDVLQYQKDVCAAMQTGLYAYVAHPDLFLRGYPVFDDTCEKAARAIIETAIDTQTPLEYNLLGLQRTIEEGKDGYPHPAFWKLVSEYKATAIIGIDAHTPDAYGWKERIAEAEQSLQQLGIPVTDQIRLLTD